MAEAAPTTQPKRIGKKAIVIGAGIGGTATAARLAHAGFDVEVYEKNGFAGGRCSLIEHGGYRFDQGPSLLLLPPLFRQLYTDLGTSLEDHIDLIQCSPNYLIHYHDGQTVTLSSDRAVMAGEAERWDGPGGAERLEGFLAEARHHAALSYSLVLGQTFPSLLSYLRPSFLINVISLHPFSPLWDRCCRYFQTERMRRAFSFGSMYLGSSPFESPGTYSLLQWTETCEGIWYPKGGFQSVPRSLQRIAESHNAIFHFNSPISAVLRDSSGRAKGVQLDSGEVKEADVVVVNADLVWAYNNLFTKDGVFEQAKQGKQVAVGQDKEYRNGDDDVAGAKEGVKGKVQEVKEGMKRLLDPRKAKRLLGKPHSCSSISFYWAMDRQLPQLRAHNIFLAEEYKSSFDDIFKNQSLPREASFYVNVPSRVDPTAAPQGKDAVVVLVPVGHLVDEAKTKGKGKMNVSNDGQRLTQSQDWEALVERARGQVIRTMEERLGVRGLRGMIAWEEVNTPLTWKEKFNLTHGSILGITHDFFNVLFFRHPSRHPRVPGAYFVGASAHPGTGVPIAIAGSKLCAEAILADHAVPFPSTYTKSVSDSWAPPKGDEALNKRHKRALLYSLEDVGSAVLPYVMGAVLMVVVVWAVRVLSGGKWDVVDHIDDLLADMGIGSGLHRQSGARFAKAEEVVPQTMAEQVKQGLMDQVARVKEVVDHNGEGVGKGLVLGLPALLMGAGWVRAQRVRGRGGVRRGM